MKHIIKTTITTLIFCILLCFTPEKSLAAAKNPDDVAKLQKFVNSQVAKGQNCLNA